MSLPLPPCGVYRTRQAVVGIPAGRLVYFHNHGEPGPGLYLPSRWHMNRAEWHPHGYTLSNSRDTDSLEPLLKEGLYAVREPFFCCEMRCVDFHVGQLVQLGYDSEAHALLFLPEWTRNGLSFPETGSRVEHHRLLEELQSLRVADAVDVQAETFVH